MERLKPLFVTFATIFAALALTNCGPTGKFKESKDIGDIVDPSAKTAEVKVATLKLRPIRGEKLQNGETENYNPSEACLYINEEFKGLGLCSLKYTDSLSLVANFSDDNKGSFSLSADSTDEEIAIGTLKDTEIVEGDIWFIKKSNLLLGEDNSATKINYILKIEVLSATIDEIRFTYQVIDYEVLGERKQDDATVVNEDQISEAGDR